MRISDWSSDVCSSDLLRRRPEAPRLSGGRRWPPARYDRPRRPAARRGAGRSAAGGRTVAGHHGPARAGGGNLPRRRLAHGRAWPAAAAGGGIGAVAEAAWRGQPQRPAQARAAVARGSVEAREVHAPVVFVATAKLSSGRRFSGAWRPASEGVRLATAAVMHVPATEAS